MKTFIQLKDGVGWASVNTTGEVEGSIEVEAGTGDNYIGKKYEDGVWSEAELVSFAIVNANGDILEIKSTCYASEIAGPVMDSDIPVTAKWKDGAWFVPVETPPTPPAEELIIEEAPTE